MVSRGPSTPLRSAQDDLRGGDDQTPKSGALGESVLMVALWRQRVSGVTSRLATATLAFVNSRVRHDRGGLVGGIESRIGRTRQVVRIFIQCHGVNAWGFWPVRILWNNNRRSFAGDCAVDRVNS